VESLGGSAGARMVGSETVGAVIVGMVGIPEVGKLTGRFVVMRPKGATVDGRIGAYTVGAAVMGGATTGAITGAPVVGREGGEGASATGTKIGANVSAGFVVCPSTRRARAMKRNPRSIVLSNVDTSNSN
jgi:hypothetical protein